MGNASDWMEYGLAGLVILALFLLVKYLLENGFEKFQAMLTEFSKDFKDIRTEQKAERKEWSAEHKAERKEWRESQERSDARLDMTIRELTLAIREQNARHRSSDPISHNASNEVQQ